MKGREVREALQGSHDPKLVHCIASIAEENSALGQELTALAQLLDSIVDVTAGLADTMEAVKKAVGDKHDI
jgi:hypothetical protein